MTPSIDKFFAKAAESELGKTSPPNKIRALDIFRPEGMKAALKPYHSHIETFRSWLIKQECGETAESLRELISAEFKASGDLIEIGSAKIAIGYAALGETLKRGGADFGIALATWPPKAESVAYGKFPVVRITIIRQADIIKEIKKMHG